MINMQPVVQVRSSSNGNGCRKIERDTRSDNKFQIGKTNSSQTSVGKGGKFESPSRDILTYLTTSLIGHQVEVQLHDESVYCGLFHATNADDFGLVLKMAYLIKDGSQGQKNARDYLSKPPTKTLIIPAKDLVQVITKGVPLLKDGTNELKHAKQLEILTDSCISQSRHVEVGRELERWVPDESDPECPELENIFDDPWNRGWDQFEVNETLFGVKSTFNEELYTTKLDRGPQMRELEREATRIATEIEGEETLDIYLAEERGIELVGNLEVDEETRFSSVFRGANDSEYVETEDVLLDSQNDETFGFISESVIAEPLREVSIVKTTNGTYLLSSSSSMVVEQSSAASRDVCTSDSEDLAQLSVAESDKVPKHSCVIDSSRSQENQSIGHVDSSYVEGKGKQKVPDSSEATKTEDLHSLKNESSDKVGLSPNATEFDPSHASSKGMEKTIPCIAQSEGAVPPKTKEVQSSSSSADCGSATSTSAGRGLSPSSSIGSFSSEKSTLNPHAKEFKFNPSAKSFIPSQTPLRSPSPVAENPLYYPANMTAVTHMPGMPVGFGYVPPFASQQPAMFNPHAAAGPQPYYHPNRPQYGQQMMIGQPQQVMYMAYPQEMAYKGREF